ncbi:hypothetical protein BN1708_001764 [Verticillium longisporum]|uniref:Uncharacterized protein n=1 Tax=Verticillium longisporum TaxID=100787 RepID=A0A0G4N4K5_VERLO|nr:hypothetical protein BN1708_001764 [Verticillium longisporum]
MFGVLRLQGPNATDQLTREAADEAGLDTRGSPVKGSWRVADAERRLCGAALEGSAACADRGGSIAGRRGKKVRACRLKKSMLWELGRRGFGELLVYENVSVGIQWVSELLDLQAWAARHDCAVGGCDGSDSRRRCAGARSRCGVADMDRLRTDVWATNCRHSFRSDGRAIAPDGFLDELELLSYHDATCVEAKDPSAGLARQRQVSEL